MTNTQNQPRTVTPQEAQDYLNSGNAATETEALDAAERAAVVKALREAQHQSYLSIAMTIAAIENGAPL